MLFGIVGITSALCVVGGMILDIHSKRRRRLEDEIEGERRKNLEALYRWGKSRGHSREVMDRVLEEVRDKKRRMSRRLRPGGAGGGPRHWHAGVFEPEEVNLLDSLYFTLYTVTTMGYEDLALSPEDRLFTTVSILVYVTMVIACIIVIGNWVWPLSGTARPRGGRNRSASASVGC